MAASDDVAQAAKSGATVAGKVNLNSASAAELEKLPGVGKATAQKIIAGRPYPTVGDLSKAGVPQSTIEKIAPLVTSGPIPPSTSAAPRAAASPLFSDTPLLRTDLAGLGTHELIVSRLNTGPGWAERRHSCAGHEVVYVLEGTGALAIEGKPEQRLQPGTVAYVPPGLVRAGRNASGTGALKFLLIRIHAKGEPLSVDLN